MDTIAAIEHRASVRRFRPDAVSRELVERLLGCAVRAPNHKLTEPWRFAVLSGDSRDRFADIRAAHRARRFDDPDTPEALKVIERVRREARDTPIFIVAMCQVSEDDIQREEDYGATMMALENLMLAAESLGLATYLRTGGVMREKDLQQLVRMPGGARIVGVVSLGYPEGETEPRRRQPVGEVSWWI